MVGTWKGTEAQEFKVGLGGIPGTASHVAGLDVDLLDVPLHTLPAQEIIVLIAGRVRGVRVSHRYPYNSRLVWLILSFSLSIRHLSVLCEHQALVCAL